MNIRNLLLTSMIFCAAPIVCAAPKVSLTEQAQEILIAGMRKSFEILPSNLQEAQKKLIFLEKNKFECMLSHMRIGQSVFDFKADFDKKMITPERIKLKREFEAILHNLNFNNMDEGYAFRGMASMNMKYFDLIEKSLLSGKVITKRDIAIVEKTIADLSYYDAAPIRSIAKAQNLTEQVQKITLACIIKLNKILRPEVQQVVKKIISLKKKLEEYTLNEILKQGEGSWRWCSSPAWYEIGYNEIEALKKKLRLSVDEQNVMSALHHCKREYIWLFLDLDPKKEDFTHVIAKQKQIIKQLSYVLKCL